jgi:uncharacterized membrane protein
MLRFSLLFSALLLLVPALTAAAASFTGLGSLAGAVPGSTATGVSGDGSLVVGSCTGAASCNEAWRWTEAGGIVGIGYPPGGTTSTAVAVSADGETLVGRGLVAGEFEVFRWSPSLGFEPIDPPPPANPTFPEIRIGVVSLSGDGEVVVGYTLSDYTPDPIPFNDFTVTESWRWTSAGGFSITLAVVNPVNVGRLTDLSNDGSAMTAVLGYFDEYRAHRWQDGSFEPLPYLNYFDPVTYLCTGFPCTSSAEAITPDGSLVVGEANSQAALWFDDGSVIGMGFLPGATASIAKDVSSNGERAIGISPASSLFGTPLPFLWSAETGMLEIADVLTQAGLDLTGWTLTGVAGISNDGTVLVGTGVNPSGDSEAWRAVLPDLGSLTLPAQPPIVLQPGDFASHEGQATSYLIQASDPNGDDLTFAATGLAPGLSIDSDTGVISGTLAAGASAGAPYSVHVEVSDGTHSVYIGFSWSVAVYVPALGSVSISFLGALLAGIGGVYLRRRN